MPERSESDSRKLLRRLRDMLAIPGKGQDRLDQITHLIADSMKTQVCSIYLFRDPETLELCATEGLRKESVHQTRMKLGEGLVGRVARTGQPVNTADAPSEKGFRFMPETGEEIYSSFLGVPIQRVGEKLGVLVVQSKVAREFSEDDIYALDVVAMVLAEMTELGAFTGDEGGMKALHKQPVLFRGTSGQEGAAEGRVWLHEPRVVITNPVADDPLTEIDRIRAAVGELRVSIDDLLEAETLDKEQKQVLEAYRMFAHSRGWLRRMEEDIMRGLSAEASVEKEQSAARARMEQISDVYLRERLSDLDDLSNRLLRILTGQGRDTGAEMPENPVLIARNIGPAELLEYGRKLKGVVLEEGSVGSHAAVVARALAIPLVISAARIVAEALNGDAILVDGDQGIVHLRPEETVARAFRDKIAMQAEAQKRYASLRGLPAMTTCGTTIALHMNAGLMADLPSLDGSGADGVGLFRTELQFLIRSKMPQRAELARLYARVMDAAQGKRVAFRTLDIGSDKVLPYMKPPEEPNPAMGWRAIRVGLEVLAYPTVRHLPGRVSHISGGAGAFAVKGPKAIQAARVILAYGQRDILPDIPGLADCWGKTANQCPYCHGYELADRTTGILAVDAIPMHHATHLRDWSNDLVLLENGVPVTAEEAQALSRPGLRRMAGLVTRLHHHQGELDSAELDGGVLVPMQALYLVSRQEPASALAAQLGCEHLETPMGRHLAVDDFQRTSVNGVFAAGDLARSYPSATQAAATGNTAGAACHQDLLGLLPPR